MSHQRVRRVLITGAASGIGLEAALQLSRHGDHIIVADRNTEGGKATVRRIAEDGGSAEFRHLDLGDLSSIAALAKNEVERELALDVLINNAGLLPPMNRATTRDGFELEFGIAHLGHFALTSQLLPSLLRSEYPRVVSVSSIAHRTSRLNLNDLQYEHNYKASSAYGATKLACLMFAFELHRRSTAAGKQLISVAAHPGVAITPIAAGWKSENRQKFRDRFDVWGESAFMYLFGQTAAIGAQPLVYAASDKNVVGGGFYGPTRFGQKKGPPGPVKPARHALDKSLAMQLWESSARLTHANFDALNTAPAITPINT